MSGRAIIITFLAVAIMFGGAMLAGEDAGRRDVLGFNAYMNNIASITGKIAPAANETAAQLDKDRCGFPVDASKPAYRRPGVYTCDPETGKDTFDEDATADTNKMRYEIERHRHELSWALITRVLTDDEMKEVQDRGFWLLCPEGVQFREADKIKEFSDDLLQQAQLRALARKYGNDASGER